MATATLPQPHTQAQPGLRGHSWNAQSDLLKQFRVDKTRGPEQGWTGVASFDTYYDAWLDAVEREHKDQVVHRIFDQFNN
jgi:hypothetical protein